MKLIKCAIFGFLALAGWLAAPTDAQAHCRWDHPHHCPKDLGDTIRNQGGKMPEAVLDFGRDLNQWALQSGRDINQAALKAGRDVNRWWNDPDGCEAKGTCYTGSKSTQAPTPNSRPLVAVTVRVYCKAVSNGESRGHEDLTVLAPTKDEAKKRAIEIYTSRDICRYGIGNKRDDTTIEVDDARSPTWIG